MNGGWGNGFGGSNCNSGAGNLYPWLNQSDQINDGFRDQMMNNNITSIRDGIGNLSTQLCGCCGDMQMALANSTAGIQQSLCNGFAGTTAAVTGAQNAISQQLNSNEIANLNRSFAEQTANMQGFNAVNSGIADTRYTIATEACATRTTDTQNTQALLTAFNSGIQSIKDQLCEYRNDQKDDTIANLRQELMYSRGQASQVEQTAQILANNNAQTALFQQGLNNEVDALYNRLNTCPVPTTPVYGRTPIFTCNNGGCGCGCGVA